MTRRLSRLEADAVAQRREGEVLRSALRPAFPTRSAQAAYWRACLWWCLSPAAREIVDPDDWKAYGKLLAFAERAEEDQPEPQPELVGDAVATVLARARRQHAAALLEQLTVAGCRCRRDHETLWVGPVERLGLEYYAAIRDAKPELMELVNG